MLSKFHKYFLIECLINSMVALFVVITVLFVLQFGRIAPMIFSSFFDPLILLQAIFFLIPSFIAVCFPVAVFIGVLLSFVRSLKDGEWIALKASGIDSSRLVGLIMAICLVVSLLIAVLSNFIVPLSLAKVDQLLLDQSAQAVFSQIEEGRIVNLGGGNSIFIKQKSPDDRWDSPMLIMETAESSKVVYARYGQLKLFSKKRVLEFVDGVFEQETHDELTKASFSKLKFVLDDLIKSKSSISLFYSIQLVPTSKLFYQLRFAKDEISKIKIKGEISKRFAISFAVFALGLLAYALIGRVWVKSAAMTYALAGLLAISYYMLERIGLMLCEKLILNAWFGAWLPIVAFMLLLPFVSYKRKW